MEHSPTDKPHDDTHAEPYAWRQKSGVKSILSRCRGTQGSVLAIGSMVVLVVLMFFIPAFIVAVGVLFYPSLATLLLLLLFSLVAYKMYAQYQQKVAFWKKIAKEKGWGYTKFGKPNTYTVLLFSVGRFRRMYHILRGVYESLPVQIFQYKYVAGFGRFMEGRSASVFTYRTGVILPHCYLNHKNDRHFTPPPTTKLLPIPEKFAKMFDLYVAPEYEIEALALFTDEVLQHIVDMHWTHDVELVRDEIYVIYDNPHEALFETKLKKGAEFALFLQSVPSASGFTPIRETPYTFGEIRKKLPFWSINRHGIDKSLWYSFYGLVLLVTLLTLLSRLMK